MNIGDDVEGSKEQIQMDIHVQIKMRQKTQDTQNIYMDRRSHHHYYPVLALVSSLIDKN